MKEFDSNAQARRKATLFALVLVLSGVSLGRLCAEISLTGANGRAVAFHLIKDATPKGLTAQMVADGPVIGITWEKLDLGALEREHKLIYAAYLRSKEGETIPLNLDRPVDDMAPPAAPDADKGGDKAKASRYPGWFDTSVGKLPFMLQLPLGKPRGVLVISLDDFGRSFQQLGNQQRGNGPWAEFQTKYDLALLTYDIADGERNLDPTVIDDFVFAAKGSGKALESALSSFAVQTKVADLIDLPIALYGAERTGAAFVYNFVHYKPERILAAVVSKGAFYDAEPTPESAKVPMLFVWGEYSNNHELWKSENYAESVLAKAAPLAPNWTNGREFRGPGDPSPVADFFGKRYLIEVLADRLPEKAPPPPPPPAEGEGKDGKDKGGSAPSTPAEGEKPKEEPTPAAPEKPRPVEVDRSKGYHGNVETGEVLKITDPAAPMGEDETFIPNEGVSKLWKKFVIGELEAPLPAPPLQ